MQGPPVRVMETEKAMVRAMETETETETARARARATVLEKVRVEVSSLEVW
jgi:hypothetical protein